MCVGSKDGFPCQCAFHCGPAAEWNAMVGMIRQGAHFASDHVRSHAKAFSLVHIKADMDLLGAVGEPTLLVLLSFGHCGWQPFELPFATGTQNKDAFAHRELGGTAGTPASPRRHPGAPRRHPGAKR